MENQLEWLYIYESVPFVLRFYLGMAWKILACPSVHSSVNSSHAHLVNLAYYHIWAVLAYTLLQNLVLWFYLSMAGEELESIHLSVCQHITC